MAAEFIVGHHRSLALAEARARRENLEIVSRRRSDGRYSSRGHTFTFRKLEEEKGNFEWIVTLRPSKDAEKQIDYIVTAPSEAEAMSLLSQHLHNGNLAERNMAGFVVVDGIARGHATSERAGKVSYRGEPDEE